MSSTNREINIRIVVNQYSRNLIIAGPTVLHFSLNIAHFQAGEASQAVPAVERTDAAAEGCAVVAGVSVVVAAAVAAAAACAVVGAAAGWPQVWNAC